MPFAFEKMDQPDAPRQFAELATVAFAVLVFGTLGIAILAGPVVQIKTPPRFHAAAAGQAGRVIVMTAGGLLAAFPLALVVAGVVDRKALKRLRAQAVRSAQN